jgi:hypothetical protein
MINDPVDLGGFDQINLGTVDWSSIMMTAVCTRWIRLAERSRGQQSFLQIRLAIQGLKTGWSMGGKQMNLVQLTTLGNLSIQRVAEVVNRTVFD